MTAIDYRNGVAIGVLICYLPALAIAILLVFRHGFGRSAGWRFLATFALARILSSCFQLATISQPDNTALYSGEFVLLNIAISPLQLTALGLLSRVLESINKTYNTIVTNTHIRLVSLVNLVGLILIVVGGVEASKTQSNGGTYSPAIESKVGEGVFIFTFVAICAITVLLSFSVSHAEHGEKRLLFAVAISIPFLLTRLVYGSIQLYSSDKQFNSIGGDVTILLCMALLEELVVTYLYGIVGLTLETLKKKAIGTSQDQVHLQGMSDGRVKEII